MLAPTTTLNKQLLHPLNWVSYIVSWLMYVFQGQEYCVEAMVCMVSHDFFTVEGGRGLLVGTCMLYFEITWWLWLNACWSERGIEKTIRLD